MTRATRLPGTADLEREAINAVPGCSNFDVVGAPVHPSLMGELQRLPMRGGPDQVVAWLPGPNRSSCTEEVRLVDEIIARPADKVRHPDGLLSGRRC